MDAPAQVLVGQADLYKATALDTLRCLDLQASSPIQFTCIAALRLFLPILDESLPGPVSSWGEFVMRRSSALGLGMALLAGCVTFSRLDTGSHTEFPDRDTTPVSAQQMKLLAPGDWYLVQLPEREGRSSVVRGVFYSGYVGRVQVSDEDSLTLTEVAKCTFFNSRSALRHLPFVGLNFEGWSNCRNESGSVTVPRSKVLWFEPISAEKAGRFRRYGEIEVAISDGSNSQTPFCVFGNNPPDVSFVLPKSRIEKETRYQRWIEVREMKTGQWYNIIPIETQGTPNQVQIHVALVHHVDEDSVSLTNVTTGSISAFGGVAGSTTSSELTLRYTEIDRVNPLTPEEAAEQIAWFNHPQD